MGYVCSKNVGKTEETITTTKAEEKSAANHHIPNTWRAPQNNIIVHNIVNPKLEGKLSQEYHGIQEMVVQVQLRFAATQQTSYLKGQHVGP